MPQVATDQNSRMLLRIRPADKALLTRAAALQQTDLTEFVISTAVHAAREVIGHAERFQLSERDSLRVLELLENPPPPNTRLLAAAHAMAIRF